ncbi:MAG: helix-turn-helix transcriptional regulator [Oscillatoriophycideae cyanobacterium NC_groundwater_1537_Pr4_S-0.65um_50_18]|nr:helix-turn-helix transcriptional regulator [Oscillatoriophycideae cyanobacterium NC_groundwater_1537_Pr4_S-0.65um_50_18]
MGVGRSTVHYWFNNTQDPTAESVLQIIEALQKIDKAAAKDFVRLYLGDVFSNVMGIDEISKDD